MASIRVNISMGQPRFPTPNSGQACHRIHDHTAVNATIYYYLRYYCNMSMQDHQPEKRGRKSKSPQVSMFSTQHPTCPPAHVLCVISATLLQ